MRVVCRWRQIGQWVILAGLGRGGWAADNGPGAVVEEWPAAATAAADAKELEEVSLGLRGGGWPLFIVLQWELRLDQKRKVVVRGQERCLFSPLSLLASELSCLSSSQM